MLPHPARMCKHMRWGLMQRFPWRSSCTRAAAAITWNVASAGQRCQGRRFRRQRWRWLRLGRQPGHWHRALRGWRGGSKSCAACRDEKSGNCAEVYGNRPKHRNKSGLLWPPSHLPCSTTQIRLLVAVLVSILSFSFAKAEASNRNLPDSKGWYLGVDGGLPFGLSTFSSFGHDKTHMGWAAGIYGGYRFNPIFSAELSARYGEVNLSAQDCCVERNYWLGSDGVLYNASVLGMDSWEYAQLKSHVRMGWYGARGSRESAGAVRNTAHSRWTVAVSPHLYAVTTCADIQTWQIMLR